ncbi:Killer toxin subunits alpha/beta [Mycena venus]|uniref:Killer toxin subunits alpha/beta n=1 Tax=Mycena venus TaxID=2733690 RepID=A0A8H6X268_9AGAR|nr:Killer toxin subunits alpha/beta [Mycena venus]
MASMEFFGAPVYVQGGNHTIIQHNFARAAAYQPRWDDRLRNAYLNVTCNDPSALCGPSTPAYHVDPEPTPYPVLSFCSLFFEQRSLAEAVENAMGDRNGRYDLRSYDRNQGSTFLHQILHISAVGQPPITDIMETTYEGREYGPAIGPLRCKYLAFANERNNVAETIRNADNYVQFAMAMFVQEDIGYPHMPVIWEPEEDGEGEGRDLDMGTVTLVGQTRDPESLTPNLRSRVQKNSRLLGLIQSVRARAKMIVDSQYFLYVTPHRTAFRYSSRPGFTAAANP